MSEKKFRPQIWEIISKKADLYPPVPPPSKTTYVDHFGSFINKNFKISKIATFSNYTHSEIMAACKFSRTFVGSFKSYGLPNLCSDFWLDKFLCTENFRKKSFMSRFDSLPVRILTLLRLHSGGGLLP